MRRGGGGSALYTIVLMTRSPILQLALDVTVEGVSAMATDFAGGGST